MWMNNMKPNLFSASLCRPIFTRAFIHLKKILKSWSNLKILKVITSITHLWKSPQYFLVNVFKKQRHFQEAAPFHFQPTLKSCRLAHKRMHKAWMTRNIPCRSIINHMRKLAVFPSNDFKSYILRWFLVDPQCFQHTGTDNHQQNSGFAQKCRQTANGTCRNLCESWGGAILDCMYLYGKWSIFGYEGRFSVFFALFVFYTCWISILSKSELMNKFLHLSATQQWLQN